MCFSFHRDVTSFVTSIGMECRFMMVKLAAQVKSTNIQVIFSDYFCGLGQYVYVPR